MKRVFLAIGILVSSSCFAANSSLINSYNPAVRGGMDVWIDIDLLYWKPWEKALVATNKKSDVFTTDDFTKTSVDHPDFEWNLGYRLNGGYLFSSYCWDVEASWTHYTSHASQHKSSNGSSFLGMFPIWSLSDDVIAGDYVFGSNLNWKFNVNILDVQFGRYFNSLCWLELKPFVGLRSAWIRQHGHIAYQGGIFLIGIVVPGVSLNGTDYIKMRNNYWGMGPRVGIAPRIIIGKGFSFNGEAAVSGLYGCFNVKQKETYLNVIRFSHDEHLNRFRWMSDFAAGIQLKRLFKKERYGLTFKVDWEYHIFFRQFELETGNFNLISGNRNLYLQGVTFSARFDF